MRIYIIIVYKIKRLFFKFVLMASEVKVRPIGELKKLYRFYIKYEDLNLYY